MCGILVDGDDTTGFRSALIAQFTGISLQRHDLLAGLQEQAWSDYNNLNTTITSMRRRIMFG